MGIDMNNYKMLYKDQVFNVVSIMPTFSGNFDEKGAQKIETIDAFIIDEDGVLKIIRDEAWMFKFVRR